MDLSTAQARLGRINSHLDAASSGQPCAARGSACSAGQHGGRVTSAEHAVSLVPDGATLTVSARVEQRGTPVLHFTARITAAPRRGVRADRWSQRPRSLASSACPAQWRSPTRCERASTRASSRAACTCCGAWPWATLSAASAGAPRAARRAARRATRSLHLTGRRGGRRLFAEGLIASMTYAVLGMSQTVLIEEDRVPAWNLPLGIGALEPRRA